MYLTSKDLDQKLHTFFKILLCVCLTCFDVQGSFDGNSMKVAELLVENGFKEAYYIKGGARGKNGWLVCCLCVFRCFGRVHRLFLILFCSQILRVLVCRPSKKSFCLHLCICILPKMQNLQVTMKRPLLEPKTDLRS